MTFQSQEDVLHQVDQSRYLNDEDHSEQHPARPDMHTLQEDVQRIQNNQMSPVVDSFQQDY